jgi:ribosomal subunit interface protein
MDVTINARHGRVPDSLRNQALQRFTRFERLDRRITGGTLVFDGTPNGNQVEARLSVAGGPPLVSNASGTTPRAAMDGALDRLERQIKRRRQRMIDRRVRSGRRSDTVAQ